MPTTDTITPRGSMPGLQEKDKFVREMFNGISHRYDFLNHFLSAGIDRIWRKAAMKLSGLSGGDAFLDVACGTGDLSIEAVKSEPARIVGVDFAENMLHSFEAKKDKLGLDGRIDIVQASAESLPFAEGSFDVTAVAFGARNFANLVAGLSEMRRVLKRGGRIVVLEFSKPRRFPVKQLYFFYFRRVLPLIGKMVSGNGGAYTYLPDSVSMFPDGEDFLNVMRAVQFKDVSRVELTFGIATAYVGVK